MDAAGTLEQYTQDVSNLPAELQHLLSELGSGDANLYELRRKISQKDSTIHKFIKQHGSLTKNPKENQLYPKIREDFRKAEVLQKEKCIIANTALYLTSKHFMKLESDIEKLRSEGLLAVDDLDLDLEDDLFSSRGSSRAATIGLSSLANGPLAQPHSTNSDNESHVNGSANGTSTLKKYSRKSGATRASTPQLSANGSSRPPKRHKADDTKISEPTDSQNSTVGNGTGSLNLKVQQRPPKNDKGDEENELYCFCQRVSFGEMVGCDNDDCKYEWFHYECVGLTEPPQGKWYCPDCSERMKLKENKKKRKI